jgi:thiamine biosynthesis protein ThiI
VSPRETATGTAVEAARVVVGRYGELWLKGRNRRQFERVLLRNVKLALKEITPVRVERLHGQIVVTPERRVADATRRMTEVFGFSSISPARMTAATPEAITAAAGGVLAEALEELPRNARVPFRVRSRRSDKRFPMTSTELDRHVADHVLPGNEERLPVELSNPELTLGIHVLADRAFLYAHRMPGAGGLPVGTLGRALVLLSGGIDSPVASYLAMKRGLETVCLSFHSYPYIGESSKKKVERLVRVLRRYQPRGRLLIAPFADVQTAIRDAAPESYRTVLYRRAMHRIADRLAEREGAGAVVTGDCLGQVASQTLENLTCIDAASERPILRPLLGFDKEETIALARRIGTYDISIEPEPDCCSVFQPTRPILRGRLRDCERAETGLDFDELVARAVDGVEVVDC